MDMTIESTPRSSDRVARLARKPVTWLVVGALAAGSLGFLLGSIAPQTVERTGQAYVGNHMASIKADGTYYGLRDSVAWTDESGTFHDDGWPTCLKMGASPTVRFETARVKVEGTSFDAVVYLDCRA